MDKHLERVEEAMIELAAGNHNYPARAIIREVVQELLKDLETLRAALRILNETSEEYIGRLQDARAALRVSNETVGEREREIARLRGAYSYLRKAWEDEQEGFIRAFPFTPEDIEKAPAHAHEACLREALEIVGGVKAPTSLNAMERGWFALGVVCCEGALVERIEALEPAPAPREAPDEPPEEMAPMDEPAPVTLREVSMDTRCASCDHTLQDHFAKTDLERAPWVDVVLAKFCRHFDCLCTKFEFEVTKPLEEEEESNYKSEYKCACGHKRGAHTGKGGSSSATSCGFEDCSCFGYLGVSR